MTPYRNTIVSISSLLFVMLLSMSWIDGHASSVKKGLPKSLVSVLTEQAIPPETLTVIVQEVDSNEPIVSLNPKTLRSPASLTKLFTTFIALDYLGPDFQWNTKIYASDSISDATVNYLLFKGEGDPYLTEKNLWSVVNKLRNLGLERIERGLQVDQHYFEANQAHPGDFDDDPLRPYNQLPSALTANFNRVDFQLVPNANTGSVDFYFDTLPNGVVIDNQLQLGKGQCSDFTDSVVFNETQTDQTMTIIAEGVFPISCSKIEHEIALTNTNHYFHGLFSDLWKQSGGELLGYIIDREKIGESEVPLLVHTSPPLNDIIRHTNKQSNNLLSRQIFLSLGNYQSDQTATLELSRLRMNAMLDKYGIDFQDQFIDNGSGLSRETVIRGETLMQLLAKIYEHPLRAELVSSLPITGIDGTMKKRFRKFPIKQRAHLKTGTLDGVTGMAGYVKGLSGKDYIVVFIHNDFSEHSYRVKEFQKALLTWIIQDYKW